MRSIAKIFVGVSLFVIACAEESPIPLESELLGFWEYQTIMVNGQERESSNYLHINADKTYAQCYLKGSWELKSNNLILTFKELESSYEVIQLSETSLTLKTYAVNGSGYYYDDLPEGTQLLIIQKLSKN